MDILEPYKEGELSQDIKFLKSILKFKNNKILIFGSASIKALKYYADYDFFTQINKKNPESDFKEFRHIFDKIKEHHNLYFIEFKIQMTNKKKIKYNDIDKIEIDMFEKNYNNIDFCKIDLIFFDNYIFREASCIYKFSMEKISKEEYINNLKNDIKELYKEKQYFKILKRKYSIYRLLKDRKKVLELTKILNSDLGKKYVEIANYDAIKLLLDNPKYKEDKLTKKKITFNLRNIRSNIKIKDLDEEIDEEKKMINNKAKILNKYFVIH